MKKYLLITLILLFSFTQKTLAQTTDSLVNKILAIDESQYVNKPLDSIIAVLPPGYIRLKIYSLGHNTARCLNVLYPNRVWVDLHVREYTNMNPVDPNRVWNITLMRREKLYKMVVRKHNDCYRNCDTY